jgi:sec-independent protein translocase protein TatA
MLKIAGLAWSEAPVLGWGHPSGEFIIIPMNIFGLGTAEILLILFLLLLFFGKDKLPGLAKSIGLSFKELKDGFASGVREDDKKKKP